MMRGESWGSGSIPAAGGNQAASGHIVPCWVGENKEAKMPTETHSGSRPRFDDVFLNNYGWILKRIRLLPPADGKGLVVFHLFLCYWVNDIGVFAGSLTALVGVNTKLLLLPQLTRRR